MSPVGITMSTVVASLSKALATKFYKAFANRSIHVDAQCLKHPTLYFQGESGGSRDVRRIGIWGLIMHHACLAQVMTLAKEDQAAFFTLVATSIADMIAPATARARGTGTPLPIWRATGYGRPANVQQSEIGKASCWGRVGQEG